MARFKIILLSLLAVSAFSAVMASTAMAKHTWWRCHEVAAGKGAFTEKLCATKVKVKGEAAGIFESEPLPAAQATTAKIKSKVFKLHAGTVTVECEVLTLKEGKIENFEGKTGRDKGTTEFTKCKAPGCTSVAEPIVVKGKESALVEGTTTKKIYDMFTPENWTEGTTKALGEKAGRFAKITLSGGTGCIATEVEGDGVAAEIEPGSYFVAQTLKFPGKTIGCEPVGTPLSPVNFWNGVAEVKLSLKAFGSATAEECGEATLELASGEAFDVQ